MIFRFADEKLKKLYYHGTGSGHYPQGVVEAFIRRVRAIDGAADERDFRAMKSLHFEKLKSSKNQYSMRLNKSWRLIVTFAKNKDGKTVVIIEINNHYGE